MHAGHGSIIEGFTRLTCDKQAKAVMEADDDNQKDLLPALCARLQRAVLNGDQLLPTVMQGRSDLTGMHPLVVKFSGTIPSMTVTNFVERVRP